MQFEDLRSLVTETFPSAIQEATSDSTPPSLRLDPTLLHDVCSWLHSNEKTYFDSLSCLTGLDNGVEAGTMEVIYHLYSVPFDIHLSLAARLDRTKPVVDSVCDIWRGANWHEREAFDLLGIRFNNHPDLRRILLPEDWDGFPLRKDYQEQETYHQIKVKY